MSGNASEDGHKTGHTTATMNAKMAKEVLGLKKEAKHMQEQLAAKTQKMDEMEQLYRTCLADRDRVISEALNHQIELDSKEERIRTLELEATERQKQIAALTYQLRKANQTMDPLAATGQFMSWVVDSVDKGLTSAASTTGLTSTTSATHSNESPSNGSKGNGDNPSPKLTKKQEEKLFIEKCRKKLAKNKQRISELEERNADLSHKNEEEVALLNQQKDALARENESSQAQVASLSLRKQELESEIKNLTQQLDDCNIETESNKKLIEEFKVRVDQYQLSLEEVAEKNMQFQMECENLKSSHDLREKENRERERAETQKLRTEILSLKLENSNLRRDIENQKGEFIDLDQAQADIHLKFNKDVTGSELGLDSFELTSGEIPTDGAVNGSGLEPKFKEVSPDLKLKVQMTFNLHESERVIDWFVITGGKLYVTEDHICVDTISDSKKVQIMNLTEIKKFQSFILPCIEFKTSTGDTLVFKGFLHRREVMKLLLQLSLKIQHVIRFFNESNEMTVASILLMKDS